ncbi:MAG: hypothetical protein REI78_07450 [Pedobacter sp.]|nr:hypothetical protein [Pedobacter sp.]MDQ8052845.1 hypothetical protein [Pedobacter sp.]
MKKITRSIIFSCVITLLALNACKHGEDESEPTKGCFSKLELSAKWYNTTTTVDTYTNASLTTKSGTAVSSTVGFLKIDGNGTYEIVKNDAASTGTWKIDEHTCKVTLDDQSITSVDIQFDILSLSASALIIKRVDGNKVITERYRTASCPTNAELTKQWDNSRTFYFDYNATTSLVNNPALVFPVGYFKLNTDLTYNVMSDGVPLNGSWKLGQPYCMLDLDATKTNARSFEVVKITADSLVIWRKDAAVAKAYLQYYLKH